MGEFFLIFVAFSEYLYFTYKLFTRGMQPSEKKEKKILSIYILHINNIMLQFT